MSKEEANVERKIIKHRNRNAAYHFQLPAFVKMVRRANAVPILDSNTVNLLEALTDLLAQMAEFDGYRPPNMDELDLIEVDVSFSFGCQYCDEKQFDVLQALDHVMTDEHPQQPDKKEKKLQRFRAAATNQYRTFLMQKHELMIRNQLLKSSLDRMVDFYLITKSFLKMTSRYLASLRVLEMVPSTVVARGVIDLLKQIDSLITRAKCVESVPEFNAIMSHLINFDVKFVSKGKVFDEVFPAMNHAARSCGLPATDYGRPVERNILQLPPIITSLPQPNNLVGTPIIYNRPPPPTPTSLANIPPFTAGPPIRMMPPPLPIQQHPMMRVPFPVPMHLVNIEQQRIQQMFFSSKVEMPQQTRTMVFEQQKMTYHTPPHLLPDQIPGVGLGNVNPTMPANCNNSPELPPLNQIGTVEHPLLSDDLKRFLENPKLDSLIENGNYLVAFSKSSVIPGELQNALKGVSPNVKVKCFGAKVSGVGYEEDFINMYVDDGNKPKTAESVQLLFNELVTFFTANNDEWVIQNTEEAGARTHLTVKNTCENLCCRITFDSEIYCSDSKLIRYYMKTFPMCQKLCYFVQEFSKWIDLNIDRYVIVVLVIFYLQRRDYLPTVAQLQSNLPQEKNCGPWLINFTPMRPQELKIKDCETDLRKSATDFFHFYGNQFSFKDSVVCPQLGLAINQLDFYPENDWRMPLKRYKTYLEEGKAQGDHGADNTLRFMITPMCVQDLLELTTNISRAVRVSDTVKFVRLCRMAYEFYSNNP